LAVFVEIGTPFMTQRTERGRRYWLQSLIYSIPACFVIPNHH